MKLHKTSLRADGRGFIQHHFSWKSGAGFTLIEILIAVGILMALATMGFIVAIGQYRTYALEADRGVVLSMLQRARSHAINNIAESDYGFRFEDPDYVFFRGSSYASRDPDFDETVPKSTIITYSGEIEFVFERLTGEANADDITISNGYKERTISVNSEGRISW